MSYLLKAFALTAVIAVSCEVEAVAISKKRLYVDQKNSTADMHIYNSSSLPSSCKLSLREGSIGKNGKIALELGLDTHEYSAKPMLRFAPKRFTIGPRGAQKVNVVFRRRPDTKNGEYLSLLSIKCADEVQQSAEIDKQVSIKPALVHNIPVIVRTNTMPAQVELKVAGSNSTSINVTASVAGKRSVTGDLILIEAESEKELSKLKDISIYPSAPNVKFTLPKGAAQDRRLKVMFKENPKFGGETEASASVN